MYEEIEHKVKDICEMKETLTCLVKTELAKGAASCDTEELGKAVDMIKDLAEAEKCCYEAHYYKTVTKAMEEYGDEDEWDGRMGYNSRRYASGQYAPTGRGHLDGYTLGRQVRQLSMQPWPKYMDSMDEMAPMGYRENQSSYDSTSDGQYNNDRMGFHMDNRSSENDTRYGQAYNQYQNARRHYTATNSKADKEEMDRHANEHLMDTMTTLREIYKVSDPELKKRIKSDLTKLVAEMPA